MDALPTIPTRAAFLQFLRVVVGIPDFALSDTSISIDYAYLVALEVVNPIFNCVTPATYVLAVNDLGADNLINWAVDTPPSTYFADLRKAYGINAFQGGVVSATSDESTSTSIEVIEGLKNLTVGDLQNLKTPWGRAYLAIAMAAGPNIWGLT